jgi:hypothetical protein
VAVGIGSIAVSVGRGVSVRVGGVNVSLAVADGVSEAGDVSDAAITASPVEVISFAAEGVGVAVSMGGLERDKIIAKVIANARKPTAAIATMTSLPRSRCIIYLLVQVRFQGVTQSRKYCRCSLAFPATNRPHVLLPAF